MENLHKQEGKRNMKLERDGMVGEQIQKDQTAKLICEKVDGDENVEEYFDFVLRMKMNKVNLQKFINIILPYQIQLYTILKLNLQ